MSDATQAFDYLTGALSGGARPSSVGTKFSPDGRALIDPGCTTICHIDQTSPAFAALVRAQDRLKAGPLAASFAFLPPSSLHMTIFDAFIESGRARERVPAHLPETAEVAEITEDISANLLGVALPQAFDARPLGIFAGFSVSMTGQDAAAEALLRGARDTLSAATSIRRADHDSYRFHITLAYALRWFSEAEAREIIAMSDDIGAELIAAMPRLTLGPVELCRFSTMHHFIPLRML